MTVRWRHTVLRFEGLTISLLSNDYLKTSVSYLTLTDYIIMFIFVKRFFYVFKYFFITLDKDKNRPAPIRYLKPADFFYGEKRFL